MALLISKTLAPFKFHHFPLGSIRPEGWLRDQLQLSADGLGGHLFDFYRCVARSTWLRGNYEYSEPHESAPYWFNYIVPLAWTLDDSRLKKQALLPGVTKLIVELPMDVHIVSRNETVGVYYGPILYAADIAYKETAHQPLN
ncbi:hypothetical protein THAR02_08862 [Trichoderma harzianum]|uniref:Uncharacterized protein n=1 Tax=Trichoderma harzianum TaxID=5544 RepID=A0A0F9XEI4_TRIHA|nr:hypothetical protein THAR02_08862 [Trichoderma harzianum]